MLVADTICSIFISQAYYAFIEIRRSALRPSDNMPLHAATVSRANNANQKLTGLTEDVPHMDKGKYGIGIVRSIVQRLPPIALTIFSVMKSAISMRKQRASRVHRTRIHFKRAIAQ